MEARPKILIIFGYHPKEIFATEVGKELLRTNSNPGIKIVRYTGRPDRRTSTYNLRRFVGYFDPLISPIILHNDDEAGFGAAIVYRVKSQEKIRIARPLLLGFASRYGGLVFCGGFLMHSTNYDLIDIELSSKMGLQKSRCLVNDFAEYLIDLYINKGIRL